MSALSQCSGCQRHVKRTETACPFCGVALEALPSTTTVPMKRLGRAALLAFGAIGAGATAVACEQRAVYGGPPVDMVEAGTPPTSPSASSTTAPTAPKPTASSTHVEQPPAPAYGAPPASAYGAPPVMKK